MPESVNTVVRVCAWMALTIASFVGMAIAAREMANGLPVFEMLTFRSLIGLVILGVYILATDRRFRTARPSLQVSRNVVHFAGQYCWTLGVIALPLAEVFALEFTVPVWTALLAALLLGERLTRPRLVAIAGGFLGVLLVVRPGAAIIDPMTFVVLLAAVCFAGSVLMVKTLTRHDSAATILFYMMVIQLPIGGLLAWPDWVAPARADLLPMLVFGVGGLTAHLGLTKSLALADAAFVLPIDYLRLPVIGLVGYFLYAESLDVWVLAGAALIIGANYYAIRAESRRRTLLARVAGDASGSGQSR